MHRHSWNWSRRSLRWPDFVGLAPNCRTAQRPSGTTARLSSWAGFAATACGRRLVGAEGTAAPSMLSVPAAAPAGKLTPTLTTPPAPANVSFVVTLTASSTAGGGCFITCRFESFRAGPGSESVTYRSCSAFSDHPLPTTGERMIGKRYMRWCTKNYGPARKRRTEKGSSLSDRIQNGVDVLDE